ncbi:MAG: hypothetical protein JO356_20030, partial [Acidobacteria bacterium]|nr:hypothetical protein [Acidobacteriota bacterium]
MNVLHMESLAVTSATQWANTLVAGLLLTAATWLVLRLFAVRNSLLRFFVWFLILIAVICLPFGLSPTAIPTQHPGHGLTLASSWAVGALIGWSLISSLLLLRVATSLWHVRQLGREARPLGRADLNQIMREFNPGRRVRLCVSDQVRVPTAIGFLHPAVLIPSWSVEELAHEQL